jgi:hypothetical protein
MPGLRLSRTIAGAVVATGLCAAAASAQQFISFSDRSHVILEGNWQSCREDDGLYAERVYDAKLQTGETFELHMGPFREFGLFRGIQDDHRDHTSSENLLRPYDVEVISNRARQEWDVAGLYLEVRLAGEPIGDCESWYVTLKRSGQTSGH